MREIHTMIIWSNASQVKPDVENILANDFSLISQFEIYWDKEKFLDNLKVFYSHSQRHCSYAAYNQILTNKISHCGNDSFALFVYEDENPVYDYRITSSGNRRVNINVFDFKKKLRDDLGGGHKIHASDNTFESNKDLTLLFGLNIDDFIHHKVKNGQINQDKIAVKNNCIGVDGYKSIEQFFYVLNNSIRYCVIRNYECLPEEYTIKGHGDIDLLVEDLNYIKYLTLAENQYPNLEYRVHYAINIANEQVLFDFRFLGDDYYDINWQNQILENLVEYNSLVKIPNTSDYFYSLLYHAYVQKSSVKEDYYERLDAMSKELGIDYHASFSLDKIRQLLDEYMTKNSFNYTTPKDKTVYFNQLFLNLDSSRCDNFGKLISTQQARLGNKVLFTEVYDNDNEITKFGSEIIIKNEVKFLEILKESKLVPRVHNINLEPNNYFVSIEKLKGTQLNKATDNPLFWKKENILSFLSQCVFFNKVLVEHQILHRDIRPENIMVHFNEKRAIELKLIDFGWSTLFSEMKNAPHPIGLGSSYKYAEGNYSDLYSTEKVLNKIFSLLDLKKQFEFNVAPEVYNDNKIIELRIENLLKKRFRFSLRDQLILFLLRHRVLFKTVLRFKKIFKK